MRSAIPYAHVLGIGRSGTLLTGAANMLGRIYLEAPWDGDALVSVTGGNVLVAELERRCSQRPDSEHNSWPQSDDSALQPIVTS